MQLHMLIDFSYQVEIEDHAQFLRLIDIELPVFIIVRKY